MLEGINIGLSALGIERTLKLVPEIDLGRIDNAFSGAASQASKAAQEAFASAFKTGTFEVPDLGFSAFAKDARAAAGRARETATALSDLAGAPIGSITALRYSMAGAGSEIDNAATATKRLDQSFNAIGGGGSSENSNAGSAKRAAEASKSVGTAATQAAKQAATGWAAVTDELARYASDAMYWGKELGNTLSGAFRNAEDAIASFVTGGKIDFKSLADSMLADITRIAVRSAILGPLANALGGGGDGLLGGLFDGGELLAGIFHSGGMAGLRADEVPAILQRGEMVLSKAQLAAMGGAREASPPVNVVMNISTPDANSFRYAQGQIAADAARAMERARRNL